MPIYDLKCINCGNILYDHFQSIKADNPICCGRKMQTVPSSCSGYCFPAEGIHLEHVSANGKTFHSKKEMVTYARKNNLELGALL